MGFKRNADELMRGVRVDKDMYQAIMEGRKMKNRGKFTLRKAVVPAAAALLVSSTMYVAADYVIDRTPLREIFAGRDADAMTVPESQKMPDIYGEVMDSVHAAGQGGAAPGSTDGAGADGGKTAPGGAVGAGTDGGRTASGGVNGAGMDGGKTVPEGADGAETAAGGAGAGYGGDGTQGIGRENTAVPMGKYGEMIIDNELFSIELLETACTGRELSLSYILTRKTEEILPVHVSVETDYYGEMLDGPSDVPADSDRLLLDNGFGDSLRWNQLPEDCIYELEENQELCTMTQLAKEDYKSGIYTLYAEYFSEKDMDMTEEPSEMGQAFSGSGTGHTYFKAPIEIISNDNYGLALSGTTDKTEGDVHFDTYSVYVSPWTVYLAMDGTYQGEISSIWGAKSSHEIKIGFKDGTETQATVRLAGMGYGFGKIDVNMRASFETAIDPDAVSSVTLDGVAIMGE